MKNLTFRQLRVFVEVARHLSFVRAAEALHLTPPAVTMQVKELEASVGLPLFDRQGRRVALTTAGEYFLVYARRLLGTLKDAHDAMARLRRVEAGLLTVGLVSTAKYFVPRLLARFREAHPGVEVRLTVSQNRETLAGAAAGQRGGPGRDGPPAEGTGARAPSRSPRTRRCSWPRRGIRCWRSATCRRRRWRLTRSSSARPARARGPRCRPTFVSTTWSRASRWRCPATRRSSRR